jgi:hypothetical protein
VSAGREGVGRQAAARRPRTSPSGGVDGNPRTCEPNRETQGRSRSTPTRIRRAAAGVTGVSSDPRTGPLTRSSLRHVLTPSASGRRRAALLALTVALMPSADAGGDDVDTRLGAAAPVSGYLRLAIHPAFGGPLLAGDEVLVGSVRNERAALTAYSLAGVARDLGLASPDVSVADLAASSQALAVTTHTVVAAQARQTPRASAWFGLRAGPLQPFPARPEAVAVAGSVVLSLEGPPGDLAQRLVARDITAGAAPRVLATLHRTLGLMGAGTFAAVIAGYNEDTAIIVFDVPTGTELYRGPARVSGWGLRRRLGDVDRGCSQRAGRTRRGGVNRPGRIASRRHPASQPSQRAQLRRPTARVQRRTLRLRRTRSRGFPGTRATRRMLRRSCQSRLQATRPDGPNRWTRRARALAM